MNYNKEGITICKRPYGETMLLSDKDERDPETISTNKKEGLHHVTRQPTNHNHSYLETLD